MARLARRTGNHIHDGRHARQKCAPSIIRLDDQLAVVAAMNAATDEQRRRFGTNGNRLSGADTARKRRECRNPVLHHMEILLLLCPERHRGTSEF